MGSEVIARPFLTSVPDGEEWSVLRLIPFITRESAPGSHWIGDWVAPTANVDSMGKRKISYPCQESNPVRRHFNVNISRFVWEVSH
jgi:hypothetical protein